MLVFALAIVGGMSAYIWQTCQRIERERASFMSVHDLPALNACLNGLATVLLTAGFILIKQGRMAAHRACMLSGIRRSGK